jgi:hypothetical protein
LTVTEPSAGRLEGQMTMNFGQSSFARLRFAGSTVPGIHTTSPELPEAEAIVTLFPVFDPHPAATNTTATANSATNATSAI